MSTSIVQNRIATRDLPVPSCEPCVFDPMASQKSNLELAAGKGLELSPADMETLHALAARPFFSIGMDISGAGAFMQGLCGEGCLL